MKWRGWNGYTSKYFLRQETKIKEMQFIQNLHHLTKYGMTNKKMNEMNVLCFSWQKTCGVRISKGENQS